MKSLQKKCQEKLLHITFIILQETFQNTFKSHVQLSESQL